MPVDIEREFFDKLAYINSCIYNRAAIASERLERISMTQVLQDRTMRAKRAFIVSVSVPLEHYDGLRDGFRTLECSKEQYDILAQVCLAECVYNLSAGFDLRSLKLNLIEILLEEMTGYGAHSDAFYDCTGRKGAMLRSYMLNVLTEEIYSALDEHLTTSDYVLVRYSRYSFTIAETVDYV